MKVNLVIPDDRIESFLSYLNRPEPVFEWEAKWLKSAIEKSRMGHNAEPGPMVFDSHDIQVVQPNVDALAIVRLFLEKHETLSVDERKEILACIRFLNSPVLKFSPTLDSIDTRPNFDTIKP